MPRFVLVYLGGNHPSTPEEGKRHFESYMAWLTGLGESAISPANPLKDTCTVNPDGTVASGSISTMSGYTIVEAETMEAAVEMARSCPFLEIEGSLEVSELVDMPPLNQAKD